MIIGTFLIDVYGELLLPKSIEIISAIMDQNLAVVSDKFDFDYRRFGYFAAQLKWVIPLKEFWNNDTIYKTLRRSLNSYFKNWTLSITLTIHQKGG